MTHMMMPPRSRAHAITVMLPRFRSLHLCNGKASADVHAKAMRVREMGR